MFEIGQHITLKGKSGKGKNRIREHGTRWQIMRIAEQVNFPISGIGPWLLVSPHPDDGDSRWIGSHTDPDFEIVDIT